MMVSLLTIQPPLIWNRSDGNLVVNGQPSASYTTNWCYDPEMTVLLMLYILFKIKGIFTMVSKASQYKVIAYLLRWWDLCKAFEGRVGESNDNLPFMEYCWSLRYHWVKALRICKIIDIRLLHLFPTWPPKPLWTNNYRELWVIEHNLRSDIVNNNALTIFLLSFI